MDKRNKERFGRYEILVELGRGAMGIVYKARDPKINRVVAVKTISLEGQPAEEEQEYRERFYREAEAAGRLSHPGIVTIFDVGEEPETRAPYIVMEFVPGQTLDKMLLSRGDRKIPPEEGLQLALEIAEALDCAHGQGVVHRDIKPANILLTEDGHAKIADFGVAKLNLANATLSGRTLGTPAYMSPEQLNGDAVDGRSDLFSLGVILYTALTKYRPFQGNSAMTVAFKVVNRDPVPATVLDNELPPGLDYIISRAIAKDPSQRYQRGMEMVLDIQELRAGREPWSMAKQPGSGTNAMQVAGERVRTSSLLQLGAAVSRKANASVRRQEQGAVVDLLETLRDKSWAGAVFLVAILVFAIRAGQFILPQGVPKTIPGNAAPAPQAIALSDVATLQPTPPTKVLKPAKAAAPSASVPRHVRVATRSALAAPSASASLPPAMLEIEVEHKFPQAKLSIWVDDRLTFTHQLEGTDKKRLVVFHHVQGHEFHAMQISPGKHNLRVEVTSDTGPFEQSASVQGEFVSGTEKMLRVQFSKSAQMSATLE
jgi:serine/threonine-protein kinase